MNGFRLKTSRGFEYLKKGFESLRLNFKTLGSQQSGFESSIKGFESPKNILATGKRIRIAKAIFQSKNLLKKGIRITKPKNTDLSHTKIHQSRKFIHHSHQSFLVLF